MYLILFYLYYLCYLYYMYYMYIMYINYICLYCLYYIIFEIYITLFVYLFIIILLYIQISIYIYISVYIIYNYIVDYLLYIRLFIYVCECVLVNKKKETSVVASLTYPGVKTNQSLNGLRLGLFLWNWHVFLKYGTKFLSVSQSLPRCWCLLFIIPVPTCFLYFLFCYVLWIPMWLLVLLTYYVVSHVAIIIYNYITIYYIIL